jgi:ligand-binding sensor domain-containing protein/DNA-binding CsgD family transcriptional regulator
MISFVKSISSYFFILFLLLHFNSKASTNSFIKNYTKQEYHAASQNWSVAQDANGYMYFANNSGLLEFDGITWNLYPAPNGAIIRAVAVDEKNRIYTAGYRELGYWERNEFGLLEYRSLKTEVEENFTTNEEFWNIIIKNETVYFQSFSKIYRYANNRFNIITPNGFINSISDVGSRLFVNIMNKGIYDITNHVIVPYLEENNFRQTEIRFILQLTESKFLIGTTNNGLLCYDGFKLTQWLPSQFDYFQKNIINRGCITKDGRVVIGTILDGISIFDKAGNLLQRLNKDNGLQNNTVLGITSDQNNNLWISLDNGIDFISSTPDPSFTIFERKELGAVYTAAIYRDKIYLGTNQGLYSRSNFNSEEPFILVPETQGQVWDCKIIDNQLFVNHNKGAFLLEGEKIRKLSSLSGGFSIVQNPTKPNSIVQSTYSNLIFYTKSSEHWTINKVNYQFNDLIRYLEIDHLGNYWAGHMYRGIFRLKFDEKDSLIENNYYGQNVFGKDNNIHVFKIENRIVFTTGDKLFTFDDLNDTIVDFASMNDKLGDYSSANRIIAAPDHYYWLITNQKFGLFKIQHSEVKLIKEYPVSLFNNQLVIGYENIVPISPLKALLCLENGYAILNADTICPASLISEIRPELRRITIDGNNGQQSDFPLDKSEISLHYNRNSLQLQFSFPYFGNDKISYQSIIEGLDKQWSEAIDKPVFSFKRIPAGRYNVKIRALNNWGEPSKEYSIRLISLPPWYFSSFAIFVYVCLFIVGLLIFRQAIISRTRQKESREREEREKELIQLRNEKLQADLSHKSSELASSTMAIIKKNEFLITLKELLHHQKEQLGTRYPDKYYENIIHKIDENMTSQDDWKVFETNFERAHEEFVKKLKDHYPDLTPSDLRLCAFLRMNLSSKEIAPLLGISVRGIENHRYRLRKRLNLDTDSNLTDFIISL